MSGIKLAIGAAAALAAAAHLRARAAGRAGSRGLSNVGVISDKTLQDQIFSCADHDEIVLLWTLDGSDITYTLADLKEYDSWLDEGDLSQEELFRHVREQAREADVFFNGIEFPVRLYRGLIAKGPDSIRPSLGRHWSVDPAVARHFALGDHEGFDGRQVPSGKHFAISMILDDPNKIDWLTTFNNFFRYTVGQGTDPSLVERQIVLLPHKDTKEIGRDIRVRQLPSR
jgi:hypothetical protein